MDCSNACLPERLVSSPYRPGAGLAVDSRRQALSLLFPSNKPSAKHSPSKPEKEQLLENQSPHHHRNVGLYRPYQCHNPPNHRPAQEEIQKHNRSDIPFAPRQSNDRRQKIHHETEAETRKEKRW